MLLTDKQLQEIREIIQDHHAAFVANVISAKAIAPAILERLKRKGLYNQKIESVKDAYLYGQVLAALDDPKVAAMTYPEFKRYLKTHPVPLTNIEQQAIAMAQQQAGQYAVGLGNRIEQQTGQLLIEADHVLRRQLRGEIKTATAENIERRESVKQLKSDLGWATQDWARDWDRIAVSEKQSAMQHGVADHYAERYGHDVRVAKRPSPAACEHCKKIHLGPDGQPRIFKLSTLTDNGTNFKKKAAEWNAVVGPLHPNCWLAGTKIQTARGLVAIEYVVPGDWVLTHRGRLKEVTQTWVSSYAGDITVLVGNGWETATTPNHELQLSDGTWRGAATLKQGQHLQSVPRNIDSLLLIDIDSKSNPPDGEQVRSFAVVRSFLLHGSVPITTVYFNGEFFIWERQVNKEPPSVGEDWVAGTRRYSEFTQGLVHQQLIGRYEAALGTTEGLVDLCGGPLSTTYCGVSAGNVGHTLRRAQAVLPDFLGGGVAPDNLSKFAESPGDWTTRHLESFGYLLCRESLVIVSQEQGVINFGPTTGHGQSRPSDPIVDRDLGTTELSRGVVDPQFSLRNSQQNIKGDFNTAHPLWVPAVVANVNKFAYQGPVYNLSVEGDETYVANGIVSHNCTCQLIRIPDGYGFDAEGRMVPGGTYGVEATDLQASLAYEDELRKAEQALGTVTFQGLTVAIETPKGGVRRWKGDDGKPGTTTMQWPYGYIAGTEGQDGEEVDCYVGPDPLAPTVFIVHQQSRKTKQYDETKCFLGWKSREEVERVYRAHYNGPGFNLWTDALDMPAFKRWLFSFQKAVPPREKFVLSKGYESTAASRGPVGGTASNFLVNTLPRERPVGDPSLLAQDIRGLYGLDHEVPEIQESWKRDLDVYTFSETLDRQVRRVDLPEDWAAQFGKVRNRAPQNKADVMRSYRQNRAVTRNTVDPKDSLQKSGQRFVLGLNNSGSIILENIQNNNSGKDLAFYKSLESVGDADHAAILSFCDGLVADGDFDDAVDLIKAATHKYTRRIPSNDPPPRYRYIYGVTSKHHDAAVKAGEKVLIHHDGKRGHYEVKEVRPDGSVTVTHDETGHTLTIKQNHLHEMFADQHKDAIDAAHQRLIGTVKAATKYGTDSQQSKAREALVAHESKYQLNSPARIASRKAQAAALVATATPTPANHRKAAKANREAAKHDTVSQSQHAELAKLHGALSKLATGAPKKRRATSPLAFSSRKAAYLGVLDDETRRNFHQADQAYWAWQDGRGPKPPPYAEGLLDPINEALGLKRETDGLKVRDRRVSSLAEGWDKLVGGARRWDSKNVTRALGVLRKVEGLGDLRLPDAAQAIVQARMEKESDDMAREALGGDVSDQLVEMGEQDVSFDPNGEPPDTSFDFGANVDTTDKEPEDATALDTSFNFGALEGDSEETKNAE